MSRETSKKSKEEKPEPEKNARGLRYITENFCLKLCEYLGGYEYPQLNSRLYLHFQGFHKIENLNRFINVKVLYLENNLIEKIEGLETLTNLTCLYLQNNYLKKIENLENNKKIVILNLSGNRIKKIENLSNLTKLEYFYMEKNNLSNYEDIENILELKTLKLLDIQSNKIDSNSNEIINLFSQLPNLRVLYLKGNNIIREINNYRRTMILKLNNLTYLDDRPIREEDRIGAEAFLKGGFNAEREAREKYRNGPKKVLSEEEKQRIKLLVEERRRKNLENLKNNYEKKKNELEEQKKKLMNEFEKFPEKREKISFQLQSIDYQLEENDKDQIEFNEENNISKDILFEEEKRKEVEKNLKLNQDDNNKGVSITIKEEEINDNDFKDNKKDGEELEEIDTSSSKLKLLSNKDDLDAID